MAIRIQVRKGAAAAWTTANPILALGEPGLETDTNLLKFGDGVSDWNTLQYFGPATTEYTEGDVDATISGPAILWEDVGDVLTPISAAKPLPVNVVSGGGTVTGTVTANAGTNLNTSALALEATLQSVKTAIELLDNTVSGNETQVDVITVPAPLNVVGTGTEAAALRVTLATDSTGVLSVDDNAGSLTVDAPIATPVNVQIGDGTLTATVRDTGASDSLNVSIVDAAGNQVTSFGGTGGTEYTEAATDASITGTAILMEGAGDTLLPVQGTVADGLLVNLGTNNDVTVTGTVAVTQSGTWDEVGINDSGNSITVDNAALSVVGTGVEATALRVTIASDSTGVLSVDDNGSSLTVDGTVTANLAAGTNNIGDVDIASITAGDTVIGRVKLSDGTDVADILDLTNSNPLTVAIVDSNGDQITSFGGGTQYTEDAAAAANPVGTAPMLVRSDAPAGVTTTDGDNIAQRGTDYGAAYVQIVSSAGAFVDSFGGGTQYTEAATDATITGTAMLMEGAGDTLVVAQGTAADGLLVNLGSNNDITVTLDADKTVGTSVMTLQLVSASSVAISSTISTDRKLSAKFYIHFGRTAATAAGAGVNIRIESSSKSSGEGHWYPEAPFTTSFAAVNDEAVSGVEAAGQTVIGAASTTGLTAGDIISFYNSGTVTQSEFHRIKSIVANTSVTLEDAIVYAQTGNTMYDGAEMFVAQVDLTAGSRYRVVADGSLFTQAFLIEVDMITWDSTS